MTNLTQHWTMTRNGALAAACVGICSACTQGADYEKPEISTPTAYRFAPAAAPSPALPEAAWWQGFGDDDLNRMIPEALSGSHDLRIAVARVEEANAVLMGTRSQGLPQVGYGASAARERTTQQGGVFPSDGGQARSIFGAALQASWEIDLWGRIERETEAARANLLASEQARRGVELTLIASVIRGYVTLLDLDSQLAIAEATIASRKQSVAIYRARLNGGFISEFEMAQILADYESAVAAAPELRRLVAQQEDALSVLLGRNPGQIERGRTLYKLSTPTVPEGLPAELLARRPDILQAEQQLIASHALIGATRARYFPRISLTGVAGFASAELGDLFVGTARTWSFAGDVTGPIYTGGGLAAATDQAQARRAQALAVYERTIQHAFRDVDDALIALETSGEIVASLERRVATLERGLTLARARYDNGYSDSLDVLDIERSLFSAQLTLAAARGDRFRALVDLYSALGGDWVEEPDAVAVASAAPGRNPERRP
ncbi:MULTISPECIES: efflux transporter outer membrane subunit [unclassified Phenylobacterium]|uniref:efflux transporter outer membrane subunit n=1 Tax=unclassified Phenylobacterium TaxID=2640670 RepID=UPI0009E877AA|nr:MULTISPECIES: efflux transporter outer membrane subunit [unclassified Phenylobacterium]